MVSSKVVENSIASINEKLLRFGGDMVKIEFLENCLKQVLSHEVRKFCYVKLSELYTSRLMWHLAALNADRVAELVVTYKEKINWYTKEVSMNVKEGNYNSLDKALKKAYSCCVNRDEIDSVKNFLKKEMLLQADNFERKNQRTHASIVYEKILSMQLASDSERADIIKKLGILNSKLGKIKDAIKYEEMAKKPVPTLEQKRQQKVNDAIAHEPSEDEITRFSLKDLGL